MDIDRTLKEAPAQIAKLAEEAEESRFLWKQEELSLKQLEAKTHLITKAEKPDLTQSDLKAEVESTDEIYRKKCDVLVMESAYKKALIEADKWINAFNSARKLANLKIQEMQSLHSTVGGKE